MIFLLLLFLFLLPPFACHVDFFFMYPALYVQIKISRGLEKGNSNPASNILLEARWWSGRRGYSFYLEDTPKPIRSRRKQSFPTSNGAIGEHPNVSLPREEDRVLATVMNPSFIHLKAASRAFYKYLTGDLLPRERCKDKDDALVIAEIALATQDPMIFES